MTGTLLAALKEAVGKENVVTGEEELERLSADALGPFRTYDRAAVLESRAQVAVVVRDSAQVAAVLRVANQNRIPVVPYAGGTGVMGGVVPVQGGIALDLRPMNRVLDISVSDRTAWVQPGVILADLERGLNEHGLMLGHDPWSTPIATVGGAIATNGVGYRAAKYGSMGQQVRGLEVVLPTGDVVQTRPLRMRAAGPDLNALFIGSEGVFGIITRAALRVFRLPEQHIFATVGFRSFDEGYPVVCELFDLGLRPALTDLTEEDAPAGARGDSRCVLYMGFEGFAEEVEAQRSRAIRVCAERGGQDLGPEGTRAYWEERYAIAERWQNSVMPLRPRERVHHEWRSFDYLHVALPVSRVLEFRARAAELVARRGVHIRETAIWTHPELFSLLLVDAEHDGEEAVRNMGATVDQVLMLAQDMGGSMEYCHGVGVKLVHLAAREWGQNLETVRRLKRALDPHNILNPGKLGL